MADGMGCKCYASGEAECACGVDWTSSKFYDLLSIAEQLQFWARRYADGRNTYVPDTINQLTIELLKLGGKPQPETAGPTKGSIWAKDAMYSQDINYTNKYGKDGTKPQLEKQ